MSVDVEVKPDHPGRFSRVQHHVIQGGSKAQGLAVSLHVSVQQEACLFDVLSLQNLAQSFLQVRRRNIGQETKAATVHTQQRNLGFGQFPGSAQ